MKKHSYAQQLANPGLRSKLPDSKLTPQLLKKRQANTAAKARLQPFVPGSSITVGQVARDRKANEQLKFGSVDSQYARTGQQIPVWFADYQRQIAAGQAASQARYAQAQSELAARTAASQAAADQSNTQTTQAQSADAASRGATPNAQVSAEANQAQASRRALSDAFASAITGQGLNEQGYSNARGTVGKAAEVTSHLKLADALALVAKDKGAERVSYTEKRRGDEQRNVLENAAFNVKAATAAQAPLDKAAARRVSRKNTRDRLNTTANNQAATEDDKYLTKYGVTRNQFLNLSPKARHALVVKPKTTAKGPSATHVNAVREKSGKGIGRLNTIQALWDTYGHTKDDQGNLPKPQQIKDRLLTHDKFSADEIHLALLLRGHKQFTQADVDAAHRLGIRLPRKAGILPSISGPPSPGLG